MTTGQSYSIRINNGSKIDGQNAIIFQKAPTLPQDVRTLAWHSKRCLKKTWVQFDWTLDFNFA